MIDRSDIECVKERIVETRLPAGIVQKPASQYSINSDLLCLIEGLFDQIQELRTSLDSNRKFTLELADRLSYLEGKK